MVNKTLLYLTLVMLLMLAGCDTSSNKFLVTVSPSAIPSSTFSPTETQTPNPTVTLGRPAATLYLTPLPTLSREQTFEKLFMSENICNVPCWWGIIPGKSTWTETKQFIEQFSELSFGVKKTSAGKPITKTLSFEKYVWYVGNPMPNTNSATTINLEVQNNIVTALEIGPELVWNFYPIQKLLEVYGQPDQLFIGNINKDANSQTFYARIYLLYKDKGILTSYGYSSTSSTSPLNICLYDYGDGYMYMWAQSVVLNFDFSELKPLESYSKIAPNTFYEKFKDKKNQCFDVSEEAWK